MGTRDARAGAEDRRERAAEFTTISGRPIERALHGRRRRGHRSPASPGRVSLHARHPRDRLSRQALDDAAVCRLRHARGDQRALQGAARGGRHRAERRLRSADADGPRSRSPAVARRSGEVRRQRHVARRHGDAVRRHRARRHHDVDDDQLAGGDDLRDVPGRGRTAGRRLEGAVGHDSERHPQGVHRAEGVHLSAAPVDAAHHRHLRVLRDAKCRAGTRSRSAAITSARPARRRCRSWRSRCATASSTCSGASTPGSTSTTSCRGCRSSSTRTATSSRRSPSTARRARSGRARCATGSARRTSGRGSCASTARPPASRSPRSSPTTTSSGRRCRRCRPCSAAPTRSTPTRSTRRWRCRPRRPQRWRSGRSRSSRTRAA